MLARVVDRRKQNTNAPDWLTIRCAKVHSRRESGQRADGAINVGRLRVRYRDATADRRRAQFFPPEERREQAWLGITRQGAPFDESIENGRERLSLCAEGTIRDRELMETVELRRAVAAPMTLETTTNSRNVDTVHPQSEPTAR